MIAASITISLLSILIATYTIVSARRTIRSLEADRTRRRTEPR